MQTVKLSKILGNIVSGTQVTTYKHSNITGLSSAEKKIFKDETPRIEDTMLLDNISDNSKKMQQAVDGDVRKMPFFAPWLGFELTGDDF